MVSTVVVACQEQKVCTICPESLRSRSPTGSRKSDAQPTNYQLPKQLVERRTFDRGVAGSSPDKGTAV